jgi:predicted transcriptional regulator of viral defense system
MVDLKKVSALPKRPFSYQEALAAGLTKYALKKLLTAGAIEKIGRGIYQLVEQNNDWDESRYRSAMLRCGQPATICLLSALEHYHVTDQIPKQIWVLVPASKRVAANDLRLVRSRNPQWDIGIRKLKHYWITTLERTLIDGLLYKRLIGSQVAIDAIKQAVSQKKIKLGDLYDMAKQMNVEHRVRPYVETLAS